MIEDRPYQRWAVNEVPRRWMAGKRRVLMVGGTGCGKGTMACMITERMIRNGKTATMMAHRRILVQTLAERLMGFNVPYHVEMANLPNAIWVRQDDNPQVVIVSKDTAISRIRKSGAWSLPDTDLLLVDEAHRGDEYEYSKLMASSPYKWRLGMTATPIRPDGSGLGSRNWDDIVLVSSVKQLTDEGYLVPLRVYSPPELGRKRAEGDKTTGVAGDPVEEWRKHAEGQRTIAFLRTVAEAREVADRFNAAGIPAAVLHADSSPEERDSVLAELKAGRRLWVGNVNLFVEGADMPELGCVQLLRKFSSLQGYIQAVGRVLRPCKNLHGEGRHKEYGILLDHSGAYQVHRYPEWCPEWRLDETGGEFEKRVKKAKEDDGLAPACQCSGCGGLFAGLPACPYCGTPVPQSKRRAKPKLVREGLAPVECSVGSVAKSAEQREWESCIAIARARNMTVKAMNCMFHQRTKVWPNQVRLTPRFSWDDRDRKVAEVYPAVRGGTPR